VKRQKLTKAGISVGRSKRNPLGVCYAELLRLRAAVLQALLEKATSRDRRPVWVKPCTLVSSILASSRRRFPARWSVWSSRAIVQLMSTRDGDMLAKVRGGTHAIDLYAANTRGPVHPPYQGGLMKMGW